MVSPYRERERQILADCLRNLREFGECLAEPPPRPGEPGRLRLQGSWGAARFVFVIHPRLSRTTLEALLHRLHASAGPEPILLLSDYLPETLASRLRQERVNFIDAAGNAQLIHPPLFIEITGRRPPGKLPHKRTLLQASTLKLIFRLLQEPGAARRTYRELAPQAGIALGAVGPALDQLAELGHLSREDDFRELRRPLPLLQRWEYGYSERLRPRLLQHLCRLPRERELAELPLLLRDAGLQGELLLGGELGAALLTDLPGATTAALHLPGDPLRCMLRLGLVPDPEGEVALLGTFGSENAWQGWRPEGVELADPLLMAAEMVCRGGFAAPIRQAVLNRFILPRLAGEETP